MASKILIKRSTTSGSVPTTSDLDTGELGLNTADKRVYTNNAGTIVELGTYPSSLNVTGNTDLDGTLNVDGASTLASGTVTGNWTVSGVLTVSTPSNSTDAARKDYVDTADALKVAKAGDTMSGNLAMGSNKVTGLGTPTDSSDAATKGYVDAQVTAVIDSAPGALDTLNELAAAINDDANFATTITNALATKLPLAGGTMTGNIVMGSNKVTSTATPTAADDLTRKGYVDTQDATKLNLSGGTMTGDVILGANKITSTATPATDDTLTRKGYVDSILGSATDAATSAAAAATSETNAATSASNASTSETNAASSASAASTSASNASTSETNASTSASSASTSATAAATSATNAATSEANAAASYDSFDDRYLGAKASDPSVDNDGDALITGALYFDSTNNVMKVYDGAAWGEASSSISGIKQDFLYTATSGQTVFSGADDNAVTMVIDRSDLLSVFLNGVRLIETTDYTVNATTNTVTLVSGATTGDTVEMEVFGNFAGQSGAEVNITGGQISGITSLGVDGNATFGDNDKAIFGAGSDLQIFHDGSESYITDNGDGSLHIQSNAFGVLLEKTNGETIATFGTDSAVNLYYDNAQKFATTSTGIDVTGTVTADGLTVATNTDPDVVIQNTTSGASTLTLRRINADDGYTDYKLRTESGYFKLLSDDATYNDQKVFQASPDGDISFYEDTGTTPKFFWDASVEELIVGGTSGAGGAGLTITSSSGDATGYLVARGDNSLTTQHRYLNKNSSGANTGGAVGHIGDIGLILTASSTSIDGDKNVVISGSGNVGIGTSSPAYPLDVKGKEVSNSEDVLRLSSLPNSGGEYVGLVFDNESSGVSAIRSVNGAPIDRSNLAFYTSSGGSPTERMRIDSSGNLFVGKTASGYQNLNGFSLETLSLGAYMITGHKSGTASGREYQIFSYNTTKIGAITQNGTTGVSYNTSSDYRLKENVVAMSGATERLKQLNPVRFNFIEDADRTVDGFLAHEAATVVPEAVHGEKDAVDADGNPDYQGIDQSKLVPLLTSALQEAIARIETLEAEVTALKGA